MGLVLGEQVLSFLFLFLFFFGPLFFGGPSIKTETDENETTASASEDTPSTAASV